MEIGHRHDVGGMTMAEHPTLQRLRSADFAPRYLSDLARMVGGVLWPDFERVAYQAGRYSPLKGGIKVPNPYVADDRGRKWTRAFNAGVSFFYRQRNTARRSGLDGWERISHRDGRATRPLLRARGVL